MPGCIAPMSDVSDIHAQYVIVTVERNLISFLICIFFSSKVVMHQTRGNGIGRICEMTGAEAMVNSQFSMLRKGGMVVMVGLPKRPLHVENVIQDIGIYFIKYIIVFVVYLLHS